jgi:hypothetical protein
MKSPKKPSKAPSLPSQDEVRRANVLREEMLSQFRTFGESLSIIRDDVQWMKPQLYRLNEKVDVLELAVRSHGQMLQNHGQMLQNHGQMLQNHGQMLQDHGQMLQSIEVRLDRIDRRLEAVEARVV